MGLNEDGDAAQLLAPFSPLKALGLLRHVLRRRQQTEL